MENRKRVILFSAAAGILSKAVSFLMLLAIVPLTRPYLGADRFGVLMTVLGYGTLFAFVDLGIGSALIRQTARARARSSSREIAEVLMAGLLLLLALGIVASAMIIAVTIWLPMSALFKNISPSDALEARHAMRTFAAVFALALPLQGLHKIYQGMQQAYLTHGASALLASVALLILWRFAPEGMSIANIIILAYGLPAIAPVLFLPWFYRRWLKGHFISLRSLVPTCRALLGAAGIYLLLQIGAVLGWGIDSSLASAMAGASEAGMLAIVQRLFQMITVPLALANAPLWAAYSDAAAREDKAFIAGALRSSLVRTAVVTLVGVGAILAFQAQASEFLFHGHSAVPSNLLYIAAFMAVLESVGNAFAMYLNGTHILKPQLVVSALFILVSAPVKYVLTLKFGIQGLIVGTIVSYISCVVLPYVTFLRRRVFYPISHYES